MERDGGGAADFGGLAAAVVRSRRRFLLTDRPPLDTSSALSEVPAARGTRIGLYSMDADGRGVASVRRVASAPLAWVVAGAAALGRGPAARRSAVSRTRAPADRLQSAPMRLSQTRQSGSGLPAGAERVGRRKPDGKPAMTPQPNAAAAPLSESSTPHSPRLTRLLPIEVQLVLVAMLPSPVRRESPYAQAVSEKVTRLRRLWKLKKASAPPGGRPADVDLGPTMTVSLSIERQSPRDRRPTSDAPTSDTEPYTQDRRRLERSFQMDSPLHAPSLSERAMAFLLQSRRKRLLVYALLLTLLLAPLRVEGLARWAGELGARPLALRHPLFAALSLLLDAYQELVGSHMVHDDAHWAVLAHLVEVLLLMVAM
ncbi:hypothetical protein CDCA_CDCA05G1680 [Cyanidium caldarium]|uniref:Uncharacterized protein n=1 Tax=Cyanidium caldarium TaxID=2771 RepID=A0AAV9ITN5_CYACA|nr:hypothetical protein CDCA_CDCA05G1680 [Cyanidium caldarium]